MKQWWAVLLVLGLAGCGTTMDAALKIPELQPGTSTETDAAAQLGKPAMELKRPEGGKVQYFTTWPFGHNTYAVTLGADGVVRSLDQRLTQDNVMSIKPGMKRSQVLERLGPPRQETREERQKLMVMEYPWLQGNREARLHYVRLSYDEVVHDVLDIHDQIAQPENH